MDERGLNERYEEWAQYVMKQNEERLKYITVNGVDYKADKVIDVLWSGWESDQQAWLVNDNGVPKLVATNHGQHMFVSLGFLEERIAEYERVLSESREVLNILKKVEN